MFWLESACRFARPMPPTPTAAMFTRSFAEMRFDRPEDSRGIKANAAAAAPALRRNSRGGSESFRGVFDFTGSPGGGAGRCKCHESMPRDTTPVGDPAPLLCIMRCVRARDYNEKAWRHREV